MKNSKATLQPVELTDALGRRHILDIRPVATTFEATKEGGVATPTLPGWVIQTRDYGFSRDGQPNAVIQRVALNLLTKDQLAVFAGCSSDQLMCYCAPMRVSDKVRPGCFWIDEQGLVCVNELWGKGRALDSDGDVLWLVYDRTGRKAVFVKFPTTKTLPILVRQWDKAPDTWGDYNEGLEDWNVGQLTEAQIKSAFWKAHSTNNLGPITNYHDAKALRQSKAAGATYFETISNLLADPQRFLDIEGDVKSTRAGLNVGGKEENLVTSYSNQRIRWGLADTCRWRVQGKPGTVDQRVLDRLIRVDWEKELALEDCLGGLSFKIVKSGGSSDTPPQPTYPSIDSRGRNLRQRLEDLSILRWTEVPHHDPTLPAVLILEVFYHRYNCAQKGRPVGFQDGRRGSSMYYQFFLPPVCSIKDGRVLWTDARELLDQELLEMDCRWNGQWIAGEQGREWQDFMWPQKLISLATLSGKSQQLQGILQKFLGKYGVPTIASYQYRTWAQYIACRQVIVNYGTSDIQKMWELVQFVRKDFRDRYLGRYKAVKKFVDRYDDYGFQSFGDTRADWYRRRLTEIPEYTVGIMGADKDSTEVYRRYGLADPQTLVPIWANPRSSAKRAGEIRSQLTTSVPMGWNNLQVFTEDGRSQLLQPRLVTAQLFIYGDDGDPNLVTTRGQLTAFPSGQQKQFVGSVFLPSIWHDPEDCDEPLEENHYWTLTGAEKVCYTTGARETIGCGKLITPDGMKNYCGVEMEQLSTLEGELVDFAISQYELMSVETDPLGETPMGPWKGKGCLETMLEEGNSRVATVLWGGRRVVGRLVDVQLHRTTTASENIRPETRPRRTSGVAKHAIRAALLHPNFLDSTNWLNWDQRYDIRFVHDVVGMDGVEPGTPRLKPRDPSYLWTLQYAGQIIGSHLQLCGSPQVVEDIQTFDGETEMRVETSVVNNNVAVFQDDPTVSQETTDEEDPFASIADPTLR